MDSKLGIIGFGRIGQVHAKCLLQQIEGAKLAAISDPFLNEAHITWLKNHGATHVQTHLEAEKILADPSITAVLICSSTDTHAEYIQKAAEAGKHIFCEKPVDFDTRRIQETLAVVARAGVQLQIGFNRRFDHNFMQLRHAVESQKIGQPQLLKITSRDPAPPPLEYLKVSGGLFLDMMIHDFDMARFLCGEVESLQALGTCLIDPQIGRAGDVDTAIVTLQFRNGALGVIDNSRQAAYGYDQRAEVLGSEGMALSDNDYAHAVRFFNAEKTESDKPLYFFLERYLPAYTLELQSFARAVRKGLPVEVSGEDGLRATELGLAAKESLASGGTVVRL
ncbi:MAG: inositol 2-dehydrogenase [Spirochaetota bacterium]